jgi:hypothetical protein
VRILETVLLGCLGWSCTTPSKEHPVDAGSPGLEQRAVRKTAAVPVATAPQPSTAPGAATSAAPAPSASESATRTGSAYFGCGQPIPLAKLWDETTESEVLEAVSAAKQCAAAHGRRLLLEFVAPWCDDCREMARLDETPVVAQTLRERFERVRINVGKWDRHEALRQNYGVKALATYVVIDPQTSRVLAQTTLEPITRARGKKLSAEDWATWLKTR